MRRKRLHGGTVVAMATEAAPRGGQTRSPGRESEDFLFSGSVGRSAGRSVGRPVGRSAGRAVVGCNMPLQLQSPPLRLQLG